MRKCPPKEVEACRLTTGQLASDESYGNSGIFLIPHGEVNLRVVVSDEYGWDHVSVSLKYRCPTWAEMCQIKKLFFRDDEWVVQYHPAVSDHINCHPYCLHLWRPHGVEFPKPPAQMV
jgi:hypothetical protein